MILQVIQLDIVTFHVVLYVYIGPLPKSVDFQEMIRVKQPKIKKG